MSSDAIVVLSIVVVAFVVLRWIEHQIGHRFGEDSSVERYEQKIAELHSELEKQRAQYEQRIRELERRVDFLVGELQRAGIRIRDLEQGASQKIQEPSSVLPPKPLALVVGEYHHAGEMDRQALRRANVPFHRLLNAGRADIVAFLRGQRQNSTLPPWMHVAAHASPDGIALADGLAPPVWWHEHCQGIRVIFLAACRTATVADALAGMATVVFVYEEIGDLDASDFTYAFWRRMVEHGDPLRAYRQAVIEVPQVAEFTDIRTT